LTYDRLGKWFDLPRDVRIRLDPQNPDMDRQGGVFKDSKYNKTKAYVFTNRLQETASRFGVSVSEMKRFVAVQEAGGKALLVKGVSTNKGEVATEAMSAKVNLKLAYTNGLMR
jgi:hypothetical protein